MIDSNARVSVELVAGVEFEDSTEERRDHARFGKRSGRDGYVLRIDTLRTTDEAVGAVVGISKKNCFSESADLLVFGDNLNSSIKIVR